MKDVSESKSDIIAILFKMPRKEADGIWQCL